MLRDTNDDRVAPRWSRGEEGSELGAGEDQLVEPTRKPVPLAEMLSRLHTDPDEAVVLPSSPSDNPQQREVSALHGSLESGGELRGADLGGSSTASATTTNCNQVHSVDHSRQTPTQDLSSLPSSPSVQAECHDVHRVVAMCVRDGSEFVLVNIHEASRPDHTVGQLLETVEETTRCLLNSGHPLDTLWQSPADRFWLTSADGLVITDYATGWSHPADAVFNSAECALTWSAMWLPELEDGRRSVPTSVGGTDDQEIFIGTSSGDIFRWEGTDRWTHMATPVSASLTTFFTQPGRPLYVAGFDSTLLVLSRSGWQQIWLPLASHHIIQGGAWLPVSSLLLCTNKGGILRVESPERVCVVGRVEGALHGIACARGRTFLAGKPVGAWELACDGTLLPLRKSFAACGVLATEKQLYFIPADQTRGLGFVAHEFEEGSWVYHALVSIATP
jgi:hypothetical protein